MLTAHNTLAWNGSSNFTTSSIGEDGAYTDVLDTMNPDTWRNDATTLAFAGVPEMGDQMNLDNDTDLNDILEGRTPRADVYNDQAEQLEPATPPDGEMMSPWNPLSLGQQTDFETSSYIPTAIYHDDQASPTTNPTRHTRMPSFSFRSATPPAALDDHERPIQCVSPRHICYGVSESDHYTVSLPGRRAASLPPSGVRGGAMQLQVPAQLCLCVRFG